MVRREGWPDEVFQYTNSAAASLYDAVKFGSSTALLDNLHAKLKIKEGKHKVTLLHAEKRHAAACGIKAR